MGIILDIVDKVAPEAQELMENQGVNLKEALKISFNRNGYANNKWGYECEESNNNK